MPFPLPPYAYTYDGLQIGYFGGSLEQLITAQAFQFDVVTEFTPTGKQLYAVHNHPRFAVPNDWDIRVTFVDPSELPDDEGVDTTYGGVTIYTSGEKTIQVKLSNKIFDPDSPAPYNDVKWLYECLEHEWGHCIVYVLMEHFGEDLIKRAMCSYFNRPVSAWDSGPWRSRVVEAVAENYKDIALKPEWRLFNNRTSLRLRTDRADTFRDLMTNFKVRHWHPNVLESGDYYSTAYRLPDLFDTFYAFPALPLGAIAPLAHVWQPNEPGMPEPGDQFLMRAEWAAVASADFSFDVEWTTSGNATIQHDTLTVPDPPGDWALYLTVPDYNKEAGLAFRIDGSGFLSNSIDLFHRAPPDNNIYDNIWWLGVAWGVNTEVIVYSVIPGTVNLGPLKRGRVQLDRQYVGRRNQRR